MHLQHEPAYSYTFPKHHPTWQFVDVETELSLLIVAHGLSTFIITADIATQGTLLEGRPECGHTINNRMQ